MRDHPPGEPDHRPPGRAGPSRRLGVVRGIRDPDIRVVPAGDHRDAAPRAAAPAREPGAGPLHSRRWQPLSVAVVLHMVALTFSERALAVPFVVPRADRRRGWCALAVGAMVDPRPGASARSSSSACCSSLAYLRGDFDKAEDPSRACRTRPSRSAAGPWSTPSSRLPRRARRVALGQRFPAIFAATPTWLVVAAAALFVLGLVICSHTGVLN